MDEKLASKEHGLGHMIPLKIASIEAASSYSPPFSHKQSMASAT